MLYILPANMAISDEQQNFLEQLALRIPLLFEAIRSGNIKSEYIVGLRRIDDRHVRLKLVAEVVDPGVNPLKTHGLVAPVQLSVEAEIVLDDLSELKIAHAVDQGQTSGKPL